MERAVDFKSPIFPAPYSRPHQCIRGLTRYPSITRGPIRFLVRGLLLAPSLQLSPRVVAGLHGVHSEMNLLLCVSNLGRTPCTVPGTWVGNRGMGTCGILHESGGRCPKDLQVCMDAQSPGSTTRCSVLEFRPPRGSCRQVQAVQAVGLRS